MRGWFFLSNQYRPSEGCWAEYFQTRMINGSDVSEQTLSVFYFGLKIDLNGHLVSGGRQLFLLHFKQHINLEAEGMHYS